ncbi:MAG: hypothetical protein RIS70_136 [Planctomycetota bacterium]
MSFWRDKVVIITGGSAGFGRSLAGVYAQAGAKLVLAARDAARLDATVSDLRRENAAVCGVPTDVTNDQQVSALIARTVSEFGRIDVLVNNAGRSTRGRVVDTTPEQFQELLELNFLSTVRCTRAALPHLIASRGYLVNVGSLAAKTVTRYLGAYPASKFPVAAYSQQLRLELKAEGVHVLLVCPGPIAREDAGQRYAVESADLPDSAKRPGGGVRIRGLDPLVVSRRILKACESRRPELILPAKARWLLAIAAISPRLGDWIVDRMTR